MIAILEQSAKLRRKEPKQVRRQQLIDATINVLARKGFAQTTVGDVARLAGLSNGIVIFHFNSKETLLVETLKWMAEEYRQNWQQALENASNDPAERLYAMVTADFNPKICTPHKLAAWCAFWAEAQSRPTYLEHCGANDIEHHRYVMQFCVAIDQESGVDTKNAADKARTIDAISDGLWLNLVTSTDPVSLENASSTIKTLLKALFPRHFDDDGLVPVPLRKLSNSPG